MVCVFTSSTLTNLVNSGTISGTANNDGGYGVIVTRLPPPLLT